MLRIGDVFVENQIIILISQSIGPGITCDFTANC